MDRRKIYLILLIVLLSYMLLGLLFTVFRANAHYDYFVIKEDSLNNNGKSYWENRCIAENSVNPVPLAQWCVDGFGNFYADTPNRFEWYFFLYLKNPMDFFVTLVLWPLHFLGVDLINFRTLGYGW